MSHTQRRRVVITGIGVLSPIGIGVDAFWQSLSTRQSGIAKTDGIFYAAIPQNVAAQIEDFTEAAARKTYLKPQRKMVKVMCREIQLGVASASLALEHSALDLETVDHTRIGVEFGANQMMSPPDMLKDGVFACVDESDHEFKHNKWGAVGLDNMEPLWLLKYLPNMPACHIGILADARGPNNSLTLAEASGNLALGEAFRVISRGSADVMITGSTGTRLHEVKCLHAVLWDQIAESSEPPQKWCRPFDKNRTGQVIGEAACSLILEDEDHAQHRGATVLGTVLGSGSSCVADQHGKRNIKQALINAMRAALRDADVKPSDIGHICAHGLGEIQSDIEESRAVVEVFHETQPDIPVTAFKSYWGNSGAGCGIVELAGSLLGLLHGSVPPTLNYETPDPDCPLNVIHGESLATSNKLALSINATNMAQASAVVVCGA